MLRVRLLLIRAQSFHTHPIMLGTERKKSRPRLTLALPSRHDVVSDGTFTIGDRSIPILANAWN
jgi:hypothetical protein